MAIELIEFNEPSGGELLEVLVSGKLTKADYDQFTPVVDRLIEQHKKLDILYVMTDFHGWDMAAGLEDTKFAFRHFSDIGRLAIVGETKWQEWMATICKPFTKADIRYFDHAAIDQARLWASRE